MYCCSLIGMLYARPKRTLLFVALFVVIAGVLGGPVAGSLQTEGGFLDTNSGSARARRPHRGCDGHPVLPGRGGAHEAPRSGRAGARAAPERNRASRPWPSQPVASRDGRQAYLLATLKAGADEADVADGLEQRFEGNQDVLLGGPLFAQHQIGDSVSEDLGRAEMLAFPILLLLSLLFFRGRATRAPAGGGHDHRARHVPRRSRSSTRPTTCRSSRSTS